MKRCLWLLTFAVTCASLAQEQLTYVDLVKRLTDLERLALLPAPGETTAQWSSYDRKSRYDAASGKYLAWDANGDNAGIIRQEGDTQVLAEMDGPGVIWRIWSATPGAGHVRIYLDGASEPAVDLPFTGYFDRKNAPFTRPMLVHTTAANGFNNYTPIPYQKSCKILADRNWGAYYHFVYTTYPKGTQVPTFKRELSAEENAALDAANKSLSEAGPTSPGRRMGEQVASGELELPAGGEVSQRLDGPAAITTARVKLDNLPASPQDRTALRELTVEVRWDDESAPSVWAPFGDFFGTAPGANKYRSLPCGLSEDGWWYCHWFMPFAKSADLTLRNDGAQARSIQFEIVTGPLTGNVARYGRFHAKWHRDAFLPPEPERAIDWTMLKTEGRGRFAGVMLHIWNPRGGWWGEGDEKFFVDGEKFPSTFGTGSEDYFGYAWSSPTLFFHPLHNQTFNSGNCRGHISVNRWHVADQVPFHKAFEAGIEKYYPNSKPTLYAATAYWYLEAGGKDPYPVVPLKERASYWNDTPLQAKTVKGALEGERLKVLSKTGGDPHEQDMSGYGPEWSGEAHLWWTDAKPGDKLDLALPVAKAGPYTLKMQLTKAIDYGIVQLALDGQKLGGPIDLFNDGVVTTGELDLGRRELSAGEHKLTVEIVGANAKAVKAYMFGLDYVKLEAGR